MFRPKLVDYLREVAGPAAPAMEEHCRRLADDEAINYSCLVEFNCHGVAARRLLRLSCVRRQQVPSVARALCAPPSFNRVKHLVHAREFDSRAAVRLAATLLGLVDVEPFAIADVLGAALQYERL